MESYNICSFEFESDQVINYKALKIHQYKWLPPHRSPVDCFALLMAQRRLNDLDAKLRSIMIYFVFRVFQIIEKSFDHLLLFFTSNFPPVPYSVSVIKNLVPVLVRCHLMPFLIPTHRKLILFLSLSISLIRLV